MKTIRVAFTAAVIVALLFSAFSCKQEVEERQPEIHPLNVEIVDNEGRIPNREVRRGDAISWENTTDDTLYFQFMDNRLIIQTGHATGIFGFELLPKQTSEEYRIGEQAPTGDNYYAVFMYRNRAFAKGESPPKIIVYD